MTARPGPVTEQVPDEIVANDATAALLAQAIDDLVSPLQAAVRDLQPSFNPATAPSGVLRWMRAALGTSGDDTLLSTQGRNLVGQIMTAYQWRGTARGLALLLELRYGVTAQVTDSGGTSWSQSPGTAPPYDHERLVRIRIDGVAEHTPLPGLADVISSAIPPQLRYQVEYRP
ncbi:phage tail protein [Catellatospora sp. NPDC049111]|uniref:phage tail protein n=1 Tax=Catellatospora sp. NPDC049111 TaxID=3155271 RepID=UPI003401A47B